jgi:hypothetical protein
MGSSFGAGGGDTPAKLNSGVSTAGRPETGIGGDIAGNDDRAAGEYADLRDSSSEMYRDSRFKRSFAFSQRGSSARVDPSLNVALRGVFEPEP